MQSQYSDYVPDSSDSKKVSGHRKIWSGSYAN